MKRSRRAILTAAKDEVRDDMRQGETGAFGTEEEACFMPTAGWQGVMANEERIQLPLLLLLSYSPFLLISRLLSSPSFPEVKAP